MAARGVVSMHTLQDEPLLTYSIRSGPTRSVRVKCMPPPASAATVCGAPDTARAAASKRTRRTAPVSAK
ncbi:MAG: hypothetical protein OZX49_00041 [Immundisolibacter sp.]|nr:hypothetical protein [Immundisolibacter sp.]